MSALRLALGALLGLAACAPSPDGAGPAEPRSGGEMLVSAPWLMERLGDPEVVVLHVGAERAEFERGHIPGARFLPLRSIVVDRDGSSNELPPVAHLDSVFEAAGVSDGSRVVVYGAPLSAARAFFTLDYLGHGERTALLDGGLEAWEAEGRPLSREEPRAARGRFTPRPREQRVVDAAWVHRRLGDASVALLDARPAAQFTGAVAGDGIPRPGHIPGAGNLFWEELLDTAHPPVLGDPERLRASFRAAGVEPGDTVVVYCRTGMQASFAYLVARHLGYPARMYDASFMDWSRRPELPVER